MTNIKVQGHSEHSEVQPEDQRDHLALADVCSDMGKPWWKVRHLLELNLLLLVPLIASYISGFDGSLMNGMQSVPIWKEGTYTEKDFMVN